MKTQKIWKVQKGDPQTLENIEETLEATGRYERSWNSGRLDKEGLESSNSQNCLKNAAQNRSKTKEVSLESALGTEQYCMSCNSASRPIIYTTLLGPHWPPVQLLVAFCGK